MTEARCDHCKHWRSGSDNAEWEAQSAGFGECLGVRERWVIMDGASKGIECAHEDSSGYVAARIGALKSARAYVQDGSEYRAELFTAPDFFCALYLQLPGRRNE